MINAKGLVHEDGPDAIGQISIFTDRMFFF